MVTHSTTWPPPSRWTRTDALALCAIVVVAVGVYVHSIPNDFVYDDHAVVEHDERSHDLSRVGELFRGGYWVVTTRPLYRPLTLLSFALNHAVTGLSAPGYRVVNIALHALVCVVVYALMKRLLGGVCVGLAAGLVYAVHPIHVEAVVPIVGRSELLAALMVITALWLYAADAADRARGMTWRYGLVVLLTWASMLCKESAIVLIGMVGAFDVWRYLRMPPGARDVPLGRFLIRRLYLRYGGMLLAVFVVFLMRQWAIGTVLGGGLTFPKVDNPLVDQPFWVRLLTGLVYLGKYVYLLAVGYPLCSDYSYDAIPLARGLSLPVLWGGVCLLGAILLAVVSLRRQGLLALPIAWFFVSYAPVSNVLVLIGTPFAERLMYLPSVAVAMIWGLGVAALARRWRERPSPRPAQVAWAVLLLAIVCAYTVQTVRRNRVWRNDEVLFRDALKKHPRSARSQYNMGAWYASHGEIDKGIEHLQRAIKIAEEYVLARIRLATCYAHGKEWSAVADVLQPLVDRTDAPSEHLIAPLHLLGRARFHREEYARAVECYERILRIDLQNAEAKRCLAEIHAEPEAGGLFDPSKAWRLAQEAANLQPRHLSCLVTAARLAVRQHRWVEARSYLLRASEALRRRADELKSEGENPAARRQLAAVARDLRRLKKTMTQQIRGTTGSTQKAETRPTATSRRRPDAD